MSGRGQEAGEWLKGLEHRPHMQEVRILSGTLGLWEVPPPKQS